MWLLGVCCAHLVRAVVEEFRVGLRCRWSCRCRCRVRAQYHFNLSAERRAASLYIYVLWPHVAAACPPLRLNHPLHNTRITVLCVRRYTLHLRFSDTGPSASLETRRTGAKRQNAPSLPLLYWRVRGLRITRFYENVDAFMRFEDI